MLVTQIHKTWYNANNPSLVLQRTADEKIKTVKEREKVTIRTEFLPIKNCNVS